MKKLSLHSLHLSSLDKMQLPVEVLDVICFLSKQSFDVYLVGGFIRDMILGINSFDLDFVVVDISPVKIGEVLEGSFTGHGFVLDKETGTTRFVLKNESVKEYTFDFTGVTKDKLEKEFERRDFTINALSISLKDMSSIEDRFSSLEDLKNKVIRSIKHENLLDDPLRFLRAYRFAALLKGRLSDDVSTFIASHIASFGSPVSRERVMLEIWKILDLEHSFEYLQEISNVGLLERIIPELSKCRKVPPNDHHHLPLYEHSLELVKTCEENFYKIPDWAKPNLLISFGTIPSPKVIALVKLASLLHDIGKPDTWDIKNVDGNEKHTFYGHDKLGEEITNAIGENLKMSNSQTHFVSKLVRYHLRPFQLSQNNAPITSRALYRFFRDVGDTTVPLLMLSLADLWATRGPKISEEDLKRNEKLIMFLFDEYKNHLAKEEIKSKKKKLINGNEIMKLTGLPPSPFVGKIIDELDEAIAIGEVSSNDEAKNWILNRVKET